MAINAHGAHRGDLHPGGRSRLDGKMQRRHPIKYLPKHCEGARPPGLCAFWKARIARQGGCWVETSMRVRPASAVKFKASRRIALSSVSRAF